ncbi:hypothetical protein [Arenimonas daejeonensis]|uniref:hypothetical protein n=1 Tax=Arenimonas daejeonensis TaxID=370777 RepID=UPI001D13B2BE|nr:hypothetical protein [Arenimonas daejeonensis]
MGWILGIIGAVLGAFFGAVGEEVLGFMGAPWSAPCWAWPWANGVAWPHWNNA